MQDSWLSEHLKARGLSDALVAMCSETLVKDEGFTVEKYLATLPPSEFTVEYLRSVNISDADAVQVLQALYTDLHNHYDGSVKDITAHDVKIEGSVSQERTSKKDETGSSSSV